MIEALAPPTRRAVFEQLVAGPACVGDLAQTLPVSRPAVSQHLKVLKEARLVRERRDGVKRIYAIDPEGLAELRQYFEQFWDQALDNFKRSVEGGDA